MTLIELKAHAYDCLAQIEMIQKELQETNRRIAEEAHKPPVEEVKADPS